jgi:hypothetical protein
MDGAEFKQLLDESNKAVLDVAYETKLAPQTVYNFIKKKRMTRSNRRVLEEYAEKLRQLKSDEISSAS